MALFDPQAYPSDRSPAAGDWAKWMRQGAEELRAGTITAAVPAFKQALALRPDDLTTALNLATALLRAGDANRALAIYERLLTMHPSQAPDQAQLHHGRGMALNAMGQRVAAIDAFRAAVTIAPSAWRSWESIADITTNETERQQAIDSVAEALVNACGEGIAQPALFVTCVGALIDAGRAADAIGFIDANVERFADITTVHDARARAWYRQGRFEAAFRSKLAALEMLDPGTIPCLQPNPFQPDAAVVALREVMAILETAGVKPFLAAGTLLGFHRDGGPLPHDRDVDIGVIRADGTPDVVTVVREHPALLLRRDTRPGDRYVALIHKGIGIDIFVHDVRDNHLLCGFSHHSGDIQWRFDRFDLTDTAFGTERWRVPDNPDHYLKQTYGVDWQTPDHGFASAISSPALFDVDPFARAYYALARARTAIVAGNIDKARALIDQSPIPVPVPHPVQDRLTVSIRNRNPDVRKEGSKR